MNHVYKFLECPFHMSNAAQLRCYFLAVRECFCHYFLSELLKTRVLCNSKPIITVRLFFEMGPEFKN